MTSLSTHNNLPTSPYDTSPGEWKMQVQQAVKGTNSTSEPPFNILSWFNWRTNVNDKYKWTPQSAHALKTCVQSVQTKYIWNILTLNFETIYRHNQSLKNPIIYYLNQQSE